MKKPLLILAALTAISQASTTLNFSVQTGTSTTHIDPSTGNPVTYSVGLISGLNGEHGPNSGKLSTAIGGTYTGQVFTDSVPGSTALSTNISAYRSTVDEGFTNNYSDFVGFHAQFSGGSIPLFSLVSLDTDGRIGTKNREWTSAFAIDTNGNIVRPTIRLNDTTDLVINNVNANWSGLGLGNSFNIDIARVGTPTTASNTIGPDNPTAQSEFDFGGAEITDLYYLWGIVDTVPNNGNVRVVQNSGVTGITVIESIPEPGTSLLTAVGLLSLCARRKRSA